VLIGSLLTDSKMNYVCRYVISTLKRFMPEDRLSNVQGVALTADGRGAVFDVPSAEVQDYLQGITFLNCFTSI
jgi:ATP-dependent RNA helicase DDX21